VSDTIVWISGATEGIGLGMARHCPYPDARIINLSRRVHPDYESVRLDLADPSTWDSVEQHFNDVLSTFTGTRAIFIHNAFVMGEFGYIGETDPALYRKEVIGNAAAPMILGEAFIRATAGGKYESGLVMLSSAAAGVPFEGTGVYCGAKAGIEQWVRVARRERQTRGVGPWVIAVRPGFVDTASTRACAEIDPRNYPTATAVKNAFDTGKGALDVDTCARDIWAALPPDPTKSVLYFGAVPE
jgi:benzil reductase ((S)-benzoin forming)